MGGDKVSRRFISICAFRFPEVCQLEKPLKTSENPEKRKFAFIFPETGLDLGDLVEWITYYSTVSQCSGLCCIVTWKLDITSCHRT